MSYVGIGASTGQTLIIPILIRSLAGSIATIDEEALSLSFDYDILMTLDSDLSEQHKNCQIVKNYECAWWTTRKSRALDSATILDKATLDKCLEKHFQQVPGQAIIADLIQSPTISTTTNTTATTGTRTSTPAQQVTLAQPARPTIAAMTATSARPAIIPQPPATSGRYRDILSSTLLDILNLYNYANMMVTSSETQYNINMRRASTFYQLYEAAVMKETFSTSTAMPILLDADSVQQVAVEELDRLRNLPATSYKWTWGESLKESEVLDLRRPINLRHKKIHSGYNLDLKDGKIIFDDSPNPSIPDLLQEEDMSLTENVLAPPDNHIPPLLAFEQIRTLRYDPLDKSSPPVVFPFNTPARLPADIIHVPRISARLTKDNLHVHTTAASDRDDRTTPDIAVEDVWLSQSEDDIRDDPLPVEDMWESDTPEEVPPANEQIPPANEEIDTVVMPVEDIWESDHSDNDDVSATTPPTGVEDIWPSDSEGDHKEIEHIWPSASDSSDRCDSTQPTVNSQVMVSPSRITIQNCNTPLLLSDTWPEPDLDNPSPENITTPGSSLDTPAPVSYRHYGPEDFTNLRDYMFEEKGSDTESSYEEDE